MKLLAKILNPIFREQMTLIIVINASKKVIHVSKSKEIVTILIILKISVIIALK